MCTVDVGVGPSVPVAVTYCYNPIRKLGGRSQHSSVFYSTLPFFVRGREDFLEALLQMIENG